MFSARYSSSALSAKYFTFTTGSFVASASAICLFVDFICSSTRFSDVISDEISLLCAFSADVDVDVDADSLAVFLSALFSVLFSVVVSVLPLFSSESYFSIANGPSGVV